MRPRLGEATSDFPSPDSALNLLPFAALRDESNRYLVDRYTFTYLTTGRDLLRLNTPLAAARSQDLIVAAPDFGPKSGGVKVAGVSAGVASGSRKSSRLSSNISAMQWDPWVPPYNAKSLETSLPNARVLTGKKATESEVKKARSPRILHVFTHGFYLPVSDRTETPLLRSGLALAGANGRRSGDEDGILTALEVSGLDLSGTELVVLAACETGVGDVKSGDSVYSLRRSLVLAGSRSQLTSLWEVDDTVTRKTMESYYRELKSGKGRSVALRNVQTEIKKEWSHPFYWAGFVQSGAWGPVWGW